MKKASPARAARKVREIEPYDPRRVDVAKFKTDISVNEWKTLTPGFGHLPFPIFPRPIDTLSPTKTVGLGRTNVTIIVPTIVQTDAAVPTASFNRQLTPSRNPVIQIHFEPAAYGITSVATYVITFSIQVFTQGTFNLSGFAGAGTVVNAGSRVLNGQTAVSLVLRNVPPAQQTFAFLEETAGQPWNWFSTRISFPPLVLTQ